jgi:hypothetical protein
MVYVWHVIFPNVSLPHMPSRTCAHDRAGTSRGGEDTPNPPPVPPTMAEAIAALVNSIADNTRFLRKMAGNQFQQHGGTFPSRTPRYYLSGVLRNPTTALHQGRGTLGI